MIAAVNVVAGVRQRDAGETAKKRTANLQRNGRNAHSAIRAEIVAISWLNKVISEVTDPPVILFQKGHRRPATKVRRRHVRGDIAYKPRVQGERFWQKEGPKVD